MQLPPLTGRALRAAAGLVRLPIVGGPVRAATLRFFGIADLYARPVDPATKPYTATAPKR